MRTSALRGPGSACWLFWLGVPRQRRHGTRLPQVLLAIRAQLCALTFLHALTALVPLQAHLQGQLYVGSREGTTQHCHFTRSGCSHTNPASFMSPMPMVRSRKHLTYQTFRAVTEPVIDGHLTGRQA